MLKSESTPLVDHSAGHAGRLGVDSRSAWVVIVLCVLFVGKGITPFANDIVHATQTALIDDPALHLTSSSIGSISACQDISEGLSKLATGPVVHAIGTRNTWVASLGAMGALVLVIPVTGATASFYVVNLLQPLFAGMIGPATTQSIAGWVDGHQLGTALGFVGVATKMTPSAMYAIYV